MTADTDIDEYFDELDRAIDQWTSTILEEGRKMVPGMIKNIDNEFRSYQEERIKEIFHDAIDRFYGDYKPKYRGEGDTPETRNHSLYDLLDVKWPADATQSAESTDKEESSNTILELSDLDEGSLFNHENATSFERGGGSLGLYNLVFKQGYHGGATGTDKHGESVSVPHWRTPYPGENNGFRGYGRWGREAERSTPPYDDIIKTLRDKEGVFDDAFEAIVRKYAGEFQREWQAKADELSAEIFKKWM